MCNIKKQKKHMRSFKIFGFLLGFCLIVGVSTGVNIGTAYADDTDNKKLQNGSFEKSQTWTGSYKTQSQSAIPSWNTTASDGQIELFRSNQDTYINGVKLEPTEGNYAAELNANEESTLYQNVATTPASIYQWGLDHGARNGTDTMALVIGPKQQYDPSKTDTNGDGNSDKGGRDQLMQMVDWLIAQGKTSVGDNQHTGTGEHSKHLIVYSKKFAEKGTFQDNSGDNAFSLIASSIYTEEWHIWIMTDNRATTGTNPWGKYGSNAVSSSGTGVDLSGDYFYTVPAGQTETLFGFVSVGYLDSPVSADKAKTYGNFLDNINFKIFHPLSGSSTLHGSGVVSDSTGATSGEADISSGYEVRVDNKLIIYAVDGVPLKVQAVIKNNDAIAGCEFVGLYYTTQDASGDLVTKFLKKDGNEIPYADNLTDEQKNGKWIKSINSNGDIIYTYYLDNITTATDLHFVFIKSPTVTYDPNGGIDYSVGSNPHDTEESANVYSFKPVSNSDNTFTYISPYVSHAAVGQNDGWKFMGWLLTGDTVSNIPEGTDQQNADKLGTLLLPAVHTIACDFSGEQTKKEQYFQIWNNGIENTAWNKATNNTTYVKWTTTDSTATRSYANVHKGLTMVAQWRWRQAFLPQLNSGSGYVDSDGGGTVNITTVTDPADINYNASYNANGGKAYYATTDEIVTAVAEAKPGFKFEGWYDGAGSDANLLSTKATYSFIETKEKVGTFYARFSGTVTQTYGRKVKNGAAWDFISGEADDTVGNLDRYTYTDVVGTFISATATAKNGYKCIGWYKEDGTEVDSSMLSSDGTTISYTTTGNATYYAGFETTVTQTFDRQIKENGTWRTISDNNVGTLTSYKHTDVVGKTATSTASPGAGYRFLGWYDSTGTPVTTGLSNNGRTISYTTTGNATYHARFERIMVTQTYKRQVKSGDTWVDTTDDSIGTVAPESITCGWGEAAGAIATEGAGYEFAGWYDAAGNAVSNAMLGSESNILSYAATADATYIARFERIMVTQTYKRQIKSGDTWVDTTDNSIGTVAPESITCEWGDTAGSTATKGAGYKFVGWYDATGNPVSNTMLGAESNILSYTATENATYYARFQREQGVQGGQESQGTQGTQSGQGEQRRQREGTVENVTQIYIRQIKNGKTWETTTEDSVGTLTCYIHRDKAGVLAASTVTAGAGYKFVGWYDEAGEKVPDEMLKNEGTTLCYITTVDATYYARFEKTTFVEKINEILKSPKTSDNWTLVLWIALFLFSMEILVVCRVMKLH
ncbi:MAG: InlB B-repeat-containing protein [Agathobacter sp.]